MATLTWSERARIQPVAVRFRDRLVIVMPPHLWRLIGFVRGSWEN